MFHLRVLGGSELSYSTCAHEWGPVGVGTRYTLIPSPVGIAICAALALISWVFWPRKQRTSKATGTYDPRTGLGRGAPGFQTNVKSIALPAELVARIRAGEQVSAEEITAAQARVAQGLPDPAKDNDWLPPTLAAKNKAPRQRRGRR